MHFDRLYAHTKRNAFLLNLCEGIVTDRKSNKQKKES